MYRVLLVEDEEIELETLRDYIDWKKNGISRVFTARNGRRALECLEENMADIVITDIQMPGMSGIELAETIVRRGYPCKIVFLTGYDDFSYIHSAFQVNAVDYLLKPFTIEEVEACLKKVRSELEKSEIADWSRKTAAKPWTGSSASAATSTRSRATTCPTAPCCPPRAARASWTS